MKNPNPAAYSEQSQFIQEVTYCGRSRSCAKNCWRAVVVYRSIMFIGFITALGTTRRYYSNDNTPCQSILSAAKGLAENKIVPRVFIFERREESLQTVHQRWAIFLYAVLNPWLYVWTEIGRIRQCNSLSLAWSRQDSWGLSIASDSICLASFRSLVPDFLSAANYINMTMVIGIHYLCHL